MLKDLSISPYMIWLDELFYGISHTWSGPQTIFLYTKSRVRPSRSGLIISEVDALQIFLPKQGQTVYIVVTTQWLEIEGNILFLKVSEKNRSFCFRFWCSQ